MAEPTRVRSWPEQAARTTRRLEVELGGDGFTPAVLDLVHHGQCPISLAVVGHGDPRLSEPNSSAVALPMPCELPVTTATRPARPRSISHLPRPPSVAGVLFQLDDDYNYSCKLERSSRYEPSQSRRR